MKTKNWLFLSSIIFLSSFLVLSGCKKESTHKNSTSSSTTTVTNITKTTAQAAAEVFDTSIIMSAHGMVWSTSPNPDFFELPDSNKTWHGTTVYEWNDTLTGLKPCTTYYVRSFYCIGSDSTFYGIEVSFKTPC